MVRKAFTGDLVHELPKGKIEPYRLWFEYLKLALETCPGRVDRKIYEPWGNVETVDFDEWFKENWKRLFATPASVSILSDANDIGDALAEADVLVIKVRNAIPLRRQIAEFTKALKRLPKSKKISKNPEPQFSIKSKRSLNLDMLRAMLRFLRILQKQPDIEIAAKEYYEWAVAWNEKIKQKKGKRSEVLIPSPIENFIEEVVLLEVDQRRTKFKVKKSPLYNNARSDLRRFQRKAEKVVSNVCAGRFPGEF